MSALLRSALIASVAFAGSIAAAQSPSFTIDDALSAPFPSGLIAAPAGARVAWIFDAEGSRNIWVAEPAANGSFTSRQLTRFTGDIGVEIGTLAWSFDGRALVFERGGEPNPRDLPLGTTPVSSGRSALGDTTPRLIGDGSSPAMAPNAEHRRLRRPQFHRRLRSLDGSGKPQTIVRDLGRDGSLAWSPDGSRIAFVSSRGDHSLVGVYDLARKSITWLAPSVDRDASPIWSPDGSKDRVHPHSSRSARSVLVDAHRRAVVHLDRRPRDGKGTRALARQRRRRQPLLSAGRKLGVRVGCGRPNRFSVGGNRLGAPLQHRRRWRHADAAHARRLRDLQRRSQSRPTSRRVFVQPGRPRSSAHLASAGRRRNADATDDGADDRRSSGVHERRTLDRVPARGCAGIRCDRRWSRNRAVDSARHRTSRRKRCRRSIRARSSSCPQPVIFRSPDGMMIHGQLFLPPDATAGATRVIPPCSSSTAVRIARCSSARIRWARTRTCTR